MEVLIVFKRLKEKKNKKKEQKRRRFRKGCLFVVLEISCPCVEQGKGDYFLVGL